MVEGPSSANNCLPDASPVIVSVPPVPSATRGVRCPLDGRAGRFNAERPVLVYCSGKLVVARTVSNNDSESKQIPLLPDISPLSVLCYRGHTTANASACKLSPSGCYMVSGDEKGGLRVWAFDHPEHLTKYENSSLLKGPVRDADWDSESKRLVVAGERLDSRSECAKAILVDGVSCGLLAQFNKGRVASCAFKPTRPFRIVTSGMDEAKCYFHAGPPFARVPPADGIPAEAAHANRGGVQCARYSHNGDWVVTVATDRSICIYEGKTFRLLTKLDNVHTATIYSVAWNKDDSQIMTASGDGTCKLFSVTATVDTASLTELHTWHPAKAQCGGKELEKVPVGGTQLGCTFVQGTLPVSVGLNGQISILPMPGSDSSGKIKVITGHYAPIAAMTVDVANNAFYTGDTNGILCKFDLTTTEPLCRLEPPAGENDDLMFVVHGTTDRPAAVSAMTTTHHKLLFSVGWDDKLYVTDTQTGAIQAEAVALGAQPVCMATGTNLVVIVTVKGVLLVDGKTGKLMNASDKMIVIPFIDEAKCVCVSADDKTVYFGGSKDCNIYIYSTSGNGGTTTLTQTSVIEKKHLKPVHSLALSHDGTKLAAGDEKDVCVFDVSGGASSEIKALVGRGNWCFHLQRITCLAWSPDDAILASGGADDAIYLWNLGHKMKRVHYPYAHRGGLTALAFCKDRELLSTGADAVVNRWNVAKDVKGKFV